MSVSFQVSAERANVNIEDGTVILTGVQVEDLVGEIGYTEFLQAIDFSHIVDYVTQVQTEDIEE